MISLLIFLAVNWAVRAGFIPALFFLLFLFLKGYNTLRAPELHLWEGKKIERGQEKVVLVGLELPYDNIEYSLAELAQLVETAGGVVVGKVTQKRPKPDVAYYIGPGKVDEIQEMLLEMEADTVVFDDELSATQHRNLEDRIDGKILDRAQLILDIFAQRARTKEGKLQVELAQLKYSLARLTGKGLVLSRLGGGIGTRGPGETKLEVDRRRIRSKISDLEKEIEEIRKHRQVLRAGRRKTSLPVVALVGYTNAGKSTLLNSLTGAEVLAEDKLFATLDPTIRKVTSNSGQEFFLVDTVGFIQKLPHHLVAAFRATLEETKEADILIHVLDSSHPRVLDQAEAVHSTLEDLDIKDKPIIIALNKIDLLDNQYELSRLKQYFPNFVGISGKEHLGMDALFARIEKLLSHRYQKLFLLLPYQEQGVLAKLHQEGLVISEDYRETDILVQARLDQRWQNKLREYFLERVED